MYDISKSHKKHILQILTMVSAYYGELPVT